MCYITSILNGKAYIFKIHIHVLKTVHMPQKCKQLHSTFSSHIWMVNVRNFSVCTSVIQDRRPWHGVGWWLVVRFDFILPMFCEISLLRHPQRHINLLHWKGIRCLELWGNGFVILFQWEVAMMHVKALLFCFPLRPITDTLQ